MTVIDLNWKSSISSQLKNYNRQWHAYDSIITHYNRVLENNTSLQSQCNKLEKDVYQLRLSNAGLEKASEANQELSSVNNKLTLVNEEILTHLREKGELAREVVRLNLSLTDSNEKLNKEEIKAQQYKTEVDQLNEKLKIAEFEINELRQINQIVQEEYHAIQGEVHQLQKEYSQMKPGQLELEQQLEKANRINKQLENELILYKNKVAAIHDMELQQVNNKIKKKVEVRRAPGSNSFLDDDLVIVPSLDDSSDFNQDSSISSSAIGDNYDSIVQSYDESMHLERKNSANILNNSGGKLFSSFMRKFTQNLSNNTNDRLYRTSTNCIVASVPTRAISQWDCTELEAYALQFQPSGSILATGGSDKTIHLWEILSNGQQRKYGSLHGSHGAINALDFDNEGCRLLAGCSGDTAYIWSYAENRTTKDTFTGHQKLINACRFISGTKLVTGSADRTIKIWDLHGRQCIQTLFVPSKCHDLVVTDAAGTLISGHYDKKIRIWDPFKNACRSELEYDASVTSLSYNDEKQRLLACFKDDTLKLIDLRQNKVIYTVSDDNFKVSTDTTKAVLSPDGRYACAGSQDGSLVVWNMDNANCENVLKRKHTTMVTSVAWQPDGTYVASCEKHRKVILWCH